MNDIGGIKLRTGPIEGGTPSGGGHPPGAGTPTGGTGVATLTPGTTLGGFLIEGRLAAGGMGTLYAATEMSLGRRVAVKVISEEAAGDEGFQSRFVHEARQASAIDHPNIVPIYGFGEECGRLYLAMRFIDGPDLDEYMIDHRPLPDPVVRTVLRQVASALDAIHARGLIHRDVKPANILLSGLETTLPHAYLTDFGIARTENETRITAAGQMVGTVVYASPEQLQSSTDLDARSDVYSLACVAYECLTGEPPFQGDTLVTVLLGHLHAPVPPASGRRPGLPVTVDVVFGRGLAKAPEDRYATCGEFVEALFDAMETAVAAEGQPGPPLEPSTIAGRPPTDLGRAAAFPSALVGRRRRLPIRALVTAAVAVVLVAGVSIRTLDSLSPSTEGRAGDPITTESLADLADAVADVRATIGTEAVTVAASSSGPPPAQLPTTDQAGAATDAALSTLEQHLDRLERSSLPATTTAAIENVKVLIGDLPDVRSRAAEGVMTQTDLVDAYKVSLEATTELLIELQYAIDGPPAGALRTLATLADSHDASIVAMAIVAGAAARDEPGWATLDGTACSASIGCTESELVAELLDDETQAAELFDDLAAADDRAARRALASTGDQAAAAELITSAITMWRPPLTQSAGLPADTSLDEMLIRFRGSIDEQTAFEADLATNLTP